MIEDYGRFLKKKGKSILSEERVRVEPFTTSILDGVDIRETIRKWYEHRIYVRQFQKIQGEVGSVVVIFDEDRDNRYPYLTTWLGENQNESDMAFYSTFPFDNMVGPGIGRAEYGGFLMSLPPRRMYDVWQDADYEFAELKSERLLLAGIDYSIHRHVVYVAAKPPRSIFKTIASRVGRTIIYIPIGQLSPVSLKKIRVVHVLDGYDKREIAKEYLVVKGRSRAQFAHRLPYRGFSPWRIESCVSGRASPPPPSCCRRFFAAPAPGCCARCARAFARNPCRYRAARQRAHVEDGCGPERPPDAAESRDASRTGRSPLKATAISSAFSSCRTLPGQEKPASRSTACELMRFRRRCPRHGRSSPRNGGPARGCRRGGGAAAAFRIGTTLSR